MAMTTHVELVPPKRGLAYEIPLRVSAKTDYALRAMAELAAAEGRLVKAERMSVAHGIPLKFLLNIMVELKHDGLVRSRRGADGGYRLARPAAEITLADVIGAVEGELFTVREELPEELSYVGPASGLSTIWSDVQARLRDHLDGITLADLVAGDVGGP